MACAPVGRIAAPFRGSAAIRRRRRERAPPPCGGGAKAVKAAFRGDPTFPDASRRFEASGPNDTTVRSPVPPGTETIRCRRVTWLRREIDPGINAADELVTDSLPAASLPAFHVDGDRRDLRLDACRGLALWFIFLDHIPDTALGWLTLRSYGFSDTTEVFFFVSGYTCMLAYGGSLRERGWRETVVRALRRGWEIYAAFLLLMIAYLAAVQAAGGGSLFLDQTNTAVFFAHPAAAIVHIVQLQYTPFNTDVLPSFVLLHLAFPAVLWLMTRSAPLALAASFLLYLLTRAFDWDLPSWPSGQWYFNPLAWQLLFVLGAFYACAGAGRLRSFVQSRAAFLLAVLYLAFALAVALSWQFKWLEGFIPDSLAKLIYPIDKSSLSPLRVVHFLSLAVVVSRLTPPDWHGPMRPLMMALIRCGENSLAIYCLGVLLSFIGYVILVEFSAGIAVQAAVGIAGVALMIAAATLLTAAAKLGRRGPELF